MAYIGMRHVVVAELDAHTAGSEPTYKTTGVVAGKAITGNLTKTYNNNPLYADDAIAEDDNGLQSMALELGLDDLDDETQAYMGMKKAVTSGTSPVVTTYYENSASAKYMGVGYIRVRRKAGSTTYQAIWIYKALFRIESENSQTKGETIEWNTPVAAADCMGLDIDGSGEVTFRKIRNFSAYDDAEDYLDGLAHVS